MQTKSLYEQYKKEFMQSDQEYCCYCLQEKEEKNSCCQENHFVTFKDLYEEDQKEIINAEIQWGFQQEMK